MAKKVSVFKGNTNDGFTVGVIAQTGNPFLTVGIAGKIMALPKTEMESIINMAQMSKKELIAKLR